MCMDDLKIVPLKMDLIGDRPEVLPGVMAVGCGTRCTAIRRDASSLVSGPALCRSREFIGERSSAE